jgi:hypothetical protein
MAGPAWLRRVVTVAVAAPAAFAALRWPWGAALLVHGLHALALREFMSLARRYQDAVWAAKSSMNTSSRACGGAFITSALLVGCSAHAGAHAVGEDPRILSVARAVH